MSAETSKPVDGSLQGLVKPRRIIIEIWDNVTDLDALYYCMKVAQKGKISGNGKQHCYHSAFANGAEVNCNLNKGSERFRVSKRLNSVFSD